MSETSVIITFEDSRQELLDKWVHNTINIQNLWDAFENEFELDWVREEGVLRFIQSVVNCIDCENPLELFEYKQLFDHMFDLFTIDSAEIPSKLMEIIDPILNPNWDWPKIKHRNLCLVLLFMLDKYITFMDEDTKQIMIEYLKKKLIPSEFPETVLLSLICLNHIFQFDIKSRTKKNIEEILIDLSHFCEQTNFKVQESNDSVQSQIRFMSQWFGRFAFATYSHSKDVLVKLSNDYLTARNDTGQLHPIKCTNQVCSEVYYYEVIVIGTGPHRIGWTSRDAMFSKSNQLIGDDNNSVGLDCHQGVIWHGRPMNIHRKIQCKTGDVVGCLIDLGSMKFQFYLNGELIKHLIKFHFSPEPYYAAACIGPHQQCSFNFGQSKFKFLPENYFEKIKHQKINQLQETYLSGNNYFFKPNFADLQQIDAFFKEECQIEFDQFVTQNSLAIKSSVENNKFQLLNLKDLIKKHGWIRLVHSINKEFTVWKKEKNSNKLYVVDKVMREYLQFVDSDLSLSNTAKFLEIIYPFIEIFSLMGSKQKHLIQSTICLSLYFWIIAERYYDQRQLVDLMTDNMVNFLKEAISESNDLWTVLVALVCIHRLIENDDNLENSFKIKNDSQLYSILVCLVNSAAATEFKDFYSSQFDSLNNQIAFLSQSCLNHVNNSVTQKYSKKSQDCFFVRNNTNLLFPVRSEFPILTNQQSSPKPVVKLTKKPNNKNYQHFKLFNESNNYYYEAILLTEGPVRVGWCTRESEFTLKEGLGVDDFSIGFDPYNRCVWHNGVMDKISIQFNKNANGIDVIGCLIDVQNCTFKFYFNSQLINYKHSEVFFFPEIYFAASSLSPHQQIYFNFGQESFRYQPKNEFSLNFHNESNKITNRYKLLEANFIKDKQFTAYWFKENPSQFDFYQNSSYSLFFQNGILQNEFNDLLTKILNAIFDITFLTKKNKMYQQIKTKFVQMIDRYENLFYHRFIQAIVCTKIDISVSLFDIRFSILWNFIEELSKIYFDKLIIEYAIENDNDNLLNEKSIYRFNDFHAKCKFVEVVNFYLVQINKSNSSLDRFRNIKIALILSVIGQIDNGFTLNNEIISMFNQILNYIQLDYATLMIIVAIEKYSKSSINFDLLKNNRELILKLEDFSKLSQLEIEYNTNSKLFGLNKISSMEYQIGFCAKWILCHLFKNSISRSNSTQIKIDFCFKNLKLSNGNTSIRCDSKNSSVRYGLHSSGKIYFYEALLLTKGPMRIGWSTKMSNLVMPNQLGDDDHSIGLDANSGIIWHNAKQIKTFLLAKNKFSASKTTKASSPESCDVVGCLLDSTRGRFVFYLNGRRIYHRKANIFTKNNKIYFFTQPYYPSASISAHQHAWINFGQTPFVHAPKRVNFRDFYSLMLNRSRQASIKNSFRIKRNIKKLKGSIVHKHKLRK